MSIDRVARAMTGGRPSAEFKARVMAPIYGRPRPDFTARVMDRIEAREAAAQPFANMFRAPAVLVPVAAILALAAGVVMLRDARDAAVTLAPKIAEAPKLPPSQKGAIQAPASSQRSAPATERRSLKVAKVVRVEADGPPHPGIYTIAPLETAQDLAAKAIDRSLRTIPALEGPAPLTFTTLPAGSGGTEKKD